MEVYVVMGTRVSYENPDLVEILDIYTNKEDAEKRKDDEF